MTLLQKLEIEAARMRRQLNALAAEAEPTPEQRSEIDALSQAYETLETRMIAARIGGDGEAGDPPGEPEPVEQDAEGQELRGLIEGASVGEIFDAAMEKRSIDGATRELQQHFDLGPNQVPLDLLREVRDVTAGVDAAVSESPTLQPVFAGGAAQFLGIPMPVVAAGAASFPVLTTRASVGGPHVDSTSVDETTGTFAANELKPSRLQAAFFFRRTDAARFRGMDSALREALSSSLMEAHDKEIIAGANGLFGGTNLAASDQSNKDTFDSFMSRWAHGQVDGRFATSLADLKILVGADTYGAMGKVYQSSGEMSVADVLAEKTAGVRVTPFAPATASDKQDGVVRLGMRADMVSPVWQGVSIVVDEITQAAKGEIRVTAYLLFAAKILRVGGFKRVTAHH